MPRDIHNHSSPLAAGEQPSAPCPRGVFLKWLPKPRPVTLEVHHA
jgi:hypothetical protein